MISTLAAILLLLAMALCLVLIPFVHCLLWWGCSLRLASQRSEAPSAAVGCGEIKEYEAEQHRGLAAIGQLIEALRGMTNEMKAISPERMKAAMRVNRPRRRSTPAISSIM